jgi:hypothetical protein
MSLFNFVAPIVTEIAPPIISAIRAEVSAHQGLTSDQRSEMLSKLEQKIDADQALVDSLTADAKPD